MTPRDDLSQFSEMLRRAEVHDARGPRRATLDPTARRRRRRRGTIAALIVIVIVLATVAGYAADTLNSPLGSAAAAASRPDVKVPAAAVLALPQEGESAISVSGADAYLGSDASGILASSGGDAALPMASISKLVTAMVVLNHIPLGASGNGPTITFSAADHALYDVYYVQDATIAAMPTGSTMSEHDAIETMLVVSACNYAEAIATWAFGSQDAFLSAAKKWLTAHGMTHTRMVEPTGLDARNVSTPSDLITLGKLAMANPAIAAIVDKRSLDIPLLAGMPNTNALLGTDGVNGIKTGTLNTSDLLYSSSLPVSSGVTLTIVGVLLGGSSREAVDTQVTALLDSLRAGFHSVTVSDAGEEVGTYSTPWGSQAQMVLPSDASVFTWSNTPITSTISTTTLKTGKNGEKVGSVTWTAGKDTVSLPVVLKGSIREPSAWWRLTHPKYTLQLP